ncbi:MAG: hypothetical protein ACTHOA_14235 [Rhodanobacter sp.]
MSRTDQIAPNRPAAPTRGSGEMPAPSSLRAQRTRTALLGGGVMLMLLFTAVSLLLARDDEPRPLTYRPMAAAQAPARLPAAPARPSPLAAEKLGNAADARVSPTIAAATSRRATRVDAAAVAPPANAPRARATTTEATPRPVPRVVGGVVGVQPLVAATGASSRSTAARHAVGVPAGLTGSIGRDSSAVQGAPRAAAFSAVPVRPQAVTLAAHPRLLLDSSTLTALRQRAAANTPQWTALKATCDSYIGGTVAYPTGNQYPDKPNLGSGYQGESYLPALLAEGMCYQVLKSSNAAAAAPYGAKAVDILMKMSMPYPGSNGWDPCTDSGYGIRFYGVGYGLGYDWVYDLLTASQRTQIYTTANAWIAAWEKSGGCASFAYDGNPIGNYYAGYFHAKAVISLATYGENPSAPAQWTDWLGNQFGARVQPYYRLHMLGGGWPEGYGNYAPLSILNMSLPAREVKTATGQDLLHASAPYTFPVDSADYSMHFTWPSLVYFDDRDDNHSNGDPSSPPPGTTPVGMFQQIIGALSYWQSPKVAVFNQYLAAVDQATGGYSDAPAWLQFLAIDPNAPKAALSTLPLSYFAPGMNAVAARSDWTTAASWMSFRAGPYTNNPAAGHEFFDQGSLALVRGGSPLLVNAGGWLVHEPGGNADETKIFNDNYGDLDGTQYSGNRQLYNIFYVRSMSGSSVAQRFGQEANTTEDDGVRTAVSAYEDGNGYVYMLATHLEDMYRTFSAGPAVSAWSRQVVYLRPNRFVVYDRTTEGSTGYDQYLAWHFPANPAAGSAPAGQHRFDVSYNGQYVGAMTTVLPTGNKTTTVGMYPGDNPIKAWQVQVRPPDTSASQRWLTVFDLSGTAAKVATASPVTVSQGGIVGVELLASDGNAVVVSSSGAPGTALSGNLVYGVQPLSAYHVVTDLLPDTGYTVTTSANAGLRNVNISVGGTTMSSHKGVLSFYVTTDGTVQGNPPPPPTPVYVPVPISALPVPGFPAPYKPGG